jgi:ABC-2 type transport system ATP-binding protein
MIQINSLKKNFKKTRVLRGINLDIKKGDRIALVGSNGAGKTTLIRCLLGQYTYEGDIFVNEMSPRKQRREVLKKISFVPQLPPPLKMTVDHLVHFAADLCEGNPEHMFDVAEKLGLQIEDVKNRVFVKLSGGEKQKLLIGIALGREAELLIMDEPAANLDPVARQVFFKLIAERLDKVSMIISSHRLDEVAALVNRVIELDRGEVTLDDHVEDNIKIDSILDCKIKVSKENDAFNQPIHEWGFEYVDGIWSGKIAGPDRLRFLGVLSRYAGLIKDISMNEKE